ncbi:PREDICTED: DNA-directed RNA polymerases I and III subunit RPAC2-like [Chaetura pelagica]|nr:PREDICTED: DNA-directed RNA polymerases I and III subunit RPAC2-like [Chaetura pelagica]
MDQPKFGFLSACTATSALPCGPLGFPSGSAGIGGRGTGREGEQRAFPGVAGPALQGEAGAVPERVQADGTDGNCVTFVLHDEDHTLGNSLRYMVMKNPDVEFCGYCITHPSESKINFRIQTRGALPAVEPFRKGLNDLMGVCQHVLNTFERSMKEYRAQREEEMQ